jgi:hypothetical protein
LYTDLLATRRAAGNADTPRGSRQKITTQKPRQKLTRRSLNLDIHTRRQAQLIESLNRFSRSLHDVDQTLVSANLKLLTSLLINERARQNSVSLNPRRQGNWPMHFAVRRLDRVNDLSSALIKHRVVVRFHADADYFVRSGRQETPMRSTGKTISSVGGSEKLSARAIMVNG